MWNKFRTGVTSENISNLYEKCRIHVREYSARLLKEKGGEDKSSERDDGRYASIMSAETEVPSCVRGYHVYKDRWAAAFGELLTCSREPTNASDSYAVAVIKDETTIGHLPRKMCRVCSVFLRRGSLINCKVTGLKCSRSKYPNEKMFRWRNIFVVKYYSSNKFSSNECRPKIFPRPKKG